MKNLKKLFVVLPLVLVMLLSVVPVMAIDIPEKYLTDAVVNQAKMSDADYKFGQVNADLMPVWIGVNDPLAEDGVGYEDGSHFKITLLNKGAVHGWVKANPQAVSYLGIAQNYVAKNLPEYNIPTYQIMHVATVDVSVMIPQEWLKKEDQTATHDETVDGKYDEVIYKFAEPVTYELANFATVEEIKAELGLTEDIEFAEDATETFVTDAKGVNYKVTKVGQDDAAATYTISPALTKVLYAKGDFVPADLAKNVDEATLTLAVSDATLGVNKTVNVEAIKVPTTTEVKDDRVEAWVKGLLIVVQESNMPVAITHHFVFEDGTEIVQTADQKWAKNAGALTIATVNPAWYMTVPGFTIDTTKTNVEEVLDEENNLVLGEKVLKGYKVDLYYTAGEGVDKGQVDAALAGNAANVANAQQLPATGAADSFALVLSSLALVVVGLFFKK